MKNLQNSQLSQVNKKILKLVNVIFSQIPIAMSDDPASSSEGVMEAKINITTCKQLTLTAA